MKKKLIITFIALIIIIGNFAGKIEAFSDVPNNTYYANAVKDLSNRKIINGFPDGTFRPNTPITRGQVAAIVAKSLNLKATSADFLTFSDVPETHIFYPYVSALSQLGIINGYTDGSFGVNDTMTRGQAAKVLTLAYGLLEANTVQTPFKDIEKNLFKTHIETLYAHRITNGVAATRYGPNETLTRGSVAVLVQKLEQIKKNSPTTITYDSIHAENVAVSYEYSETNDLIAINNNATTKKLVITPIKEGNSTLLLNVTTATGEQKLLKYEFTILNLNGSLNVQLTESTTIEAARFTYPYNEFTFTPTSATVKRANGQETKTVDLIKVASGFTFDFYAAGTYIITFTDGKTSERVNVTLIIDNYQLVGDSTFENGKLVIDEQTLNISLAKSTVILEKDKTNATPVVLAQTANTIILTPIYEGSTYLKVITGNKTTYFIIEVTKQEGQLVTSVYEAE
jgi:GH24 family phage-related lysozyme (muramidase)